MPETNDQWRPPPPGAPPLRRMSDFNPNTSCLVYDVLNEQFLRWQPQWADSYREYGQDLDREGHSGWDGLILTGWLPIEELMHPSVARLRQDDA